MNTELPTTPSHSSSPFSGEGQGTERVDDYLLTKVKELAQGSAEEALPQPPSGLRIIILFYLGSRALQFSLALEWLCNSGQVWLLLQTVSAAATERKGGWRRAVAFLCSFLEKEKV